MQYPSPNFLEHSPMSVSIRPALPADREKVLALVPRLRSFGDPPLQRPREALDGAEHRTLERALASQRPESVLLVACEPADDVLGVALAEEQSDYFTGERHGHLSIIAVADAAQGRGAGRALIRAVEQWSADRGHRYLSLNVFSNNVRAIGFYESMGYVPDTVRYVKEVQRY
jgi:ribosomal protein S18 acetylase RimI-like enzyme